jgi:hypothetical protein
MRWLQLAHTLPGRTRLRFPALRGDAAAAERIADALAAVPGVHEVTIALGEGSERGAAGSRFAESRGIH